MDTTGATDFDPVVSGVEDPFKTAPHVYPLTEGDERDLMNRFTHHVPSGDQTGRYTDLRANAWQLAREIVGSTPKSREQALALTKLEEAMFWANAAIARNE